MLANCAWISSKRLWMRSPKNHTAKDTSGSGRSESRVRRGLIATMKPTASTATTSVLTMYMIPGPTIMRTAARSLVARDMISPVRVALEVPRRRRLEVAEEVVAHVELDVAQHVTSTMRCR